LLPAHNKSDLEDIPPELKKDITFHFVETVNDVLELALEK
jgi:ATP-dependent Lon protease